MIAPVRICTPTNPASRAAIQGRRQKEFPSSLSDLDQRHSRIFCYAAPMAAKFVSIDHDSPLLLPPDLRDWLPPGHMVHFIMDAVKALDLSEARVNERHPGSSSAAIRQAARGSPPPLLLPIRTQDR